MGSQFMMHRSAPWMSSCVLAPSQRGRQGTYGGISYSEQSLPTDPVGVITLGFSGLKDGSEIKLIDIDKNVLAGSESSSGVTQFVINRFASGSPYNTIRILIISLGYEVLDLPYQLPVTNATIPVFQRIDRTYRNPT